MKRFYTAAVACASLLGTLQAQMVITTADFGTVGDTVVLVSDTSTLVLNPGPAGANQTWNFSALNNNGIDTAFFLAPNQTPFASGFPSATAAIQLGALYTYNTLDTTAVDTLFDNGIGGSLNVEGLELPSQAIPYSPYPVANIFPTNYTDHWASNYRLELLVAASSLGEAGTLLELFDIDSLRLVRTVNRLDTADAWGQLIIPNDTLPQTLRLKRRENAVDSVFAIRGSAPDTCGIFVSFFGQVFSIPCADTTVELTYQWWAANRDLPVLAFTTNEQDTLTGLLGVQYPYRAPTTNSVSSESGIDNLSLYPVPTADALNLRFTLQHAQQVHLLVADALGRTLFAETYPQLNAGAQQLVIPTASWPVGTYFLRLRTEHGTVVCRFVK
jgi:hypothetical protein